MAENPPQIFIAHAVEDKPLVRELYAKLVSAGYKPWLDEEDLLPGQNWREEIPKALKNSDLFIACLSSTSISKRGYIQREFKMAMEMLAELPPGEIYLIPLKFDDCTIPELRASEYGLNLRDIQWLDYWKPNGFDKLVKAIKHQFGGEQGTPDNPNNEPLSNKVNQINSGKALTQYNLQGAIIYGFAPESTGSNVVSGQNVQGNPIIGTQNNYGVSQMQECQQKIQELEKQEKKLLLNSEASNYYIERPPIEQRCYQEILKDGALIRIRASQKMGKSMLMNKILKWVEEDCNYQIAYLDLDEPEFNIVTDLSRLLKYFCQEVSKEVGVPNQTNEHWEKASEILDTSENMKCRNYFEQNILPQIKTALVLGLDNVDRLFSEEYQLVAADFFGMLRSWHNRGKRKKLWKKFKVILVYSTEAIPNLGIYESPFNVGLEQTLSGFSEEQIITLAQYYDCSVTRESAKVLLTQLGGHPYLIHLILESLSINKHKSLNELLAQASTEEGIYCRHFQNYWRYLQEKPKLAQVLSEAVKSDSPILIKPKILYELESLGLISKVGDQISLRCELYQTYFSNHLKILENIWRGNIDGIN